jgi:hypothetical protein
MRHHGIDTVRQPGMVLGMPQSHLTPLQSSYAAPSHPPLTLLVKCPQDESKSAGPYEWMPAEMTEYRTGPMMALRLGLER